MSDNQSSETGPEPLFLIVPKGTPFDPAVYFCIDDESDKMYADNGETSRFNSLYYFLGIRPDLRSNITARMHDASAAFSPELAVPKPAVDFLGRRIGRSEFPPQPLAMSVGPINHGKTSFLRREKMSEPRDELNELTKRLNLKSEEVQQVRDLPQGHFSNVNLDSHWARRTNANGDPMNWLDEDPVN
jgi:hypothetical protein